MSKPTERPRIAAVLAVCVCAIGLGVPAVATGKPADAATLAVTYIGSSSLQVKLGDGTTVKSGATIPAGSYQLTVDDPDDVNPNFVMNGPGVSISSNLNSSGMGIDRPAFFGPYTLQTSASYTLGDSNISGSSITFSTSAVASATGGSSSAGSSTVTSSGSSSSTASGSSSASGTMKMLGTLAGSVSASGKATLRFRGKAVTKLKAGRYVLAVADHSTKAGLIVWHLGGHAMTLSGPATRGSSSHTVTFTTGKWFFEASMAGPRTYFSITS